MSQCGKNKRACPPAWWILYHVIVCCKRPIGFLFVLLIGWKANASVWCRKCKTNLYFDTQMKTTLVENSDVFMLICLQLKKESVMLVSFSYKEVREKIFRSKKKLKKLKSWTKFRRFHNIIIKSKKSLVEAVWPNHVRRLYCITGHPGFEASTLPLVGFLSR